MRFYPPRRMRRAATARLTKGAGFGLETRQGFRNKRLKLASLNATIGRARLEFRGDIREVVNILERHRDIEAFISEDEDRRRFAPAFSSTP